MIKFFAIGLLSLASPNSEAFTLAGQNQNAGGWSTKEIKVALNPNNCPSGLQSDIDEAFALWNKVPTSGLKLVREGTSSSTGAQAYAGTNPEAAVIICDTNFGSTLGTSCNNSACTNVKAVGYMHSASKGFVLINYDSAISGNATGMASNLRKILIAHEVAHMFGLGHSQEQASIMYYSLNGKNNLALHQDDIDGVSYLYPRDEFSGDKMMGCGLFKNLGGSPPSNPPFWLALLGLPLFVFAGIRIKSTRPNLVPA